MRPAIEAFANDDMDIVETWDMHERTFTSQEIEGRSKLVTDSSSRLWNVIHEIVGIVTIQTDGQTIRLGTTDVETSNNSRGISGIPLRVSIACAMDRDDRRLRNSSIKCRFWPNERLELPLGVRLSKFRRQTDPETKSFGHPRGSKQRELPAVLSGK